MDEQKGGHDFICHDRSDHSVLAVGWKKAREEVVSARQQHHIYKNET